MLLNQFRGKSNLSREKAVGSNESRDIQRFSGGSERELVERFVGTGLAVRAARAAGLGAGAERFVDDGLDGACATAAFGAAAEASVNLLWIARQVRGYIDGTADIMVAQDVTGTNDHENGRPIGDAWSLRYSSARRDAKGKTVVSSNSKLMPEAVWNESKNPCPEGTKHELLRSRA
jgi:hypothetical protein